MARTLDPTRHAARRDVILDAASRMITTRGYDAMTIADVLGAAKISKGAFYHYFSGKDELLQAVIAGRIDGWVEATRTAMTEVDEPVEQLRVLVGALTAAKTDDRAVLVNAITQLHAEGDAALYARLRRLATDRFLPLITEVVEGGVRTGAFTVESVTGTAKVVHTLLRDMAERSTETLLAVAEGRMGAEDLQKDVRAYTAAIPAVLGVSMDAEQLIDLRLLDDWIRALTGPMSELGRAQGTHPTDPGPETER